MVLQGTANSSSASQSYLRFGYDGSIYKEIVEPGGDGLGEDGQLDSGGQALTVYDRTGLLVTSITNWSTEALAQFWGMSLEFGYDEPSNPWMWRVTSTATKFSGDFRHFSDRNDVGIVMKRAQTKRSGQRMDA